MSQICFSRPMRRLPAFRLLAAAVLLGLHPGWGGTGPAMAQTGFFQVPPPNTYPSPVTPTQFQTPPSTAPPNAFGVPSGTLAPPITTLPPSTTLQLTPPPTQGNAFDPYATPPPAQFGTPLLNPNPYGAQTAPPVYTPSVGVAPTLGPGAGGGSWWPNSQSGWPSIAWSRLENNNLPRLFSAPRARYTWLHGNNGNELGLNSLELTLSLAWMSCCGGNQPVRLTPGFTFYWWSGPDTAVTGYDMPSKTYDAYVALDYVTDQRQNSGFQTNLAVGAYTDFDTVTSESIRITGVGLGWWRVNPYTTAKLGVEYFDRVDIGWLPAFGVFMAPNSELKIDLYFPRPKIAHRLSNCQNPETWLYCGAELGGGSWTIKREAGFSDQVDVNEVRFFVGSEVLGPRGGTGFLEFGYVFDREMVYRVQQIAPLELQDAFMIRMGLAF